MRGPEAGLLDFGAVRANGPVMAALTNIKMAGQESSQLGPNTVQGIPGQGGAPPMATNSSSEKHSFVSLLEKADGLEASIVSHGAVKSAMSAPIRIVGAPDRPDEEIALEPPIQREAPQDETPQDEGPAVTKPTKRTRKTPKSGPNVPPPVREAAPSVKGNMILLHELMSVPFPVVSVAVDGSVVMVMHPIGGDQRLTPPRGVSIRARFDGVLVAGTPLEGVEPELFSTGIHMDIPDFSARCSVYYWAREDQTENRE